MISKTKKQNFLIQATILGVFFWSVIDLIKEQPSRISAFMVFVLFMHIVQQQQKQKFNITCQFNIDVSFSLSPVPPMPHTHTLHISLTPHLILILLFLCLLSLLQYIFEYLRVFVYKIYSILQCPMVHIS